MKKSAMYNGNIIVQVKREFMDGSWTLDKLSNMDVHTHIVLPSLDKLNLF